MLFSNAVAQEYGRKLVLQHRTLANDYRVMRGVKIAQTDQVYRVTDKSYGVKSQSDPDLMYFVHIDVQPWTCTCPDSIKHPEHPCKHRIAVKAYLDLVEKEIS